MGKLYFKYGAMGSGKTIELLRTIYNYERGNFKTVLFKPLIDAKGDDNIVSRMGLSRKVDALLANDAKVTTSIDDETKTIFIDEAQFLTKEQVEELWLLTKERDLIVFCYGIKQDFLTNMFPASKRLLELADKIEEIPTLCKCGKKATFSLRKLNNRPVFEGEQISIDGFFDVTYEALCGECYLKTFKEAKEAGLIRKENIF